MLGKPFVRKKVNGIQTQLIRQIPFESLSAHGNSAPKNIHNLIKISKRRKEIEFAKRTRIRRRRIAGKNPTRTTRTIRARTRTITLMVIQKVVKNG